MSRVQALAKLLPSAMKIYKDTRARRKNVPVKTEGVKVVVENVAPDVTPVGTGERKAVPSIPSAPPPRKTAPRSRTHTEAAVYTTSPAISREQVTPEKTTRAEALSRDVQGERDELYRRWSEGSVRFV